MEDLDFAAVFGRRVRLFRLSDWSWKSMGAGRFTLLVAARADAADALFIRAFAEDAERDGCVYISAWGDGCELVERLFDEVSVASERFVMSTSHAGETLSDALYFALNLAEPDPDEGLTLGEVPAVLAVEQPWVDEVCALLQDEHELARLWVAEGE